MKSILIFFLFLFIEKTESEYTHKHDCATPKSPSISSIEDILSPKQFNSDVHVHLSPCRTDTPPSKEDMKLYLRTWKNTFQNPDKKMEQLFNYLTKNYDFSNYSTECNNIICKTQEIFGEKEGVQLLYMLAKYGFNGSPFPFKQREDQAFWKAEELDNVLVALSDFPKGVLPFVFNKPLIHFKRGYTLAKYQNLSMGACVLANAFIQVFSCIHSFSRANFITTIVHEVAHVIASEGRMDRTSTWMDFSGWEKTKKYTEGKIQISYKNNKPECIFSSYGGTSPIEDFAESVVTYRYNPEELKKNCPGKYYYIADTVFDGVEYLDENQCKSHH